MTRPTNKITGLTNCPECGFKLCTVTHITAFDPPPRKKTLRPLTEAGRLAISVSQAARWKKYRDNKREEIKAREAALSAPPVELKEPTA